MQPRVLIPTLPAVLRAVGMDIGVLCLRISVMLNVPPLLADGAKSLPIRQSVSGHPGEPHILRRGTGSRAATEPGPHPLACLRS